MALSAKTSKVSSSTRKIQDVSGIPTVGTPTVDTATDTVYVPITGAAIGGQAEVYRVVSSPGGIQAISYGSSPVAVTGLTDATSYTFTARGETLSGATVGYSSATAAITPQFYAYDLIATANGTGSSGTITFDLSAVTGYKHLQIRGMARTSSTAAYDDLALRFNGDSASNYADHFLYTQTTALTSGWSGGSTGSIRVFSGAAAAASANVYCGSILDIYDYTSTSKFKTTKMLSGTMNSGVFGNMFLGSGHWRSTAAITSISISSGFLFTAASRFSLYGIRG